MVRVEHKGALLRELQNGQVIITFAGQAMLMPMSVFAHLADRFETQSYAEEMMDAQAVHVDCLRDEPKRAESGRITWIAPAERPHQTTVLRRADR